jgi:predicted ATPase
MQLVVTTQSDILVDALTDSPEAILVCEKEAGSTRMKRLKRRVSGMRPLFLFLGSLTFVQIGSSPL